MVLAAGAILAAVLAVSQTVLATSRQLAAQATVLHATRLDLGLLLSALAYGARDTVEARSSLLGALLYNPSQVAFLHGHQGAVLAVAWHPGGAGWPRPGGTGRCACGTRPHGRPWGDPQRADGRSARGRVQPGRQGAGLGGGGRPVSLWDAAGRAAPGDPLAGHTDAVLAVAFSPVADTLASAGADDVIRLWDVADRRQVIAGSAPDKPHRQRERRGLEPGRSAAGLGR